LVFYLPMWQRNKTRCTYSSRQGELATPLALHVVEVLELLKASPMAYPSNSHACVISKCWIYCSKVDFFFKMEHCLAISQSTTLKVICATITHIHSQKELHTCKKTSLGHTNLDQQPHKTQQNKKQIMRIY
jgi:hypothetical protein